MKEFHGWLQMRVCNIVESFSCWERDWLVGSHVIV